MSSLGIIPGVILLVFSGLLAAVGLDLIVQCCIMTESSLREEDEARSLMPGSPVDESRDELSRERESGDAFATDLRPVVSYNKLAQRAGWPALSPIVDAAIVIKCLGVAVSYLMVSADSLQVFHPVLFQGQSISASKGHAIWVIICSLIISPVCFFREMRGLKWSSVVGILAGVYLTLLVMIHFIADSSDVEPRGEWHWVHIESSVLARFSVFVFAFTCHQNMPSIYTELIQTDRPRNAYAIVVSVGLAGILYCIMSVCGYLQWGHLVQPNVIANYTSTNFAFTVARLVIAFYGLSSYPLQLHPVRNSLKNLLPDVWNPDSNVTHALMTIGVLAITTVIAALIQSLDLVLAVIGATGSTTLCYFLPGALFYGMKRDSASRLELAVALFLVAFGSVVMLVGLTSILLGARASLFEY